MNQIRINAFEYYKHFYSFIGKGPAIHLNLILTTLFGIFFILSIPICFWYFYGKSFVFYQIIPIGVFEILFIISFAKLTKKRDELILDIDKPCTREDLDRAKRKWLSNNLGIKPQKYLEFSKTILSLMSMESFSRSKTEAIPNGIYRHIYSHESKARITSYLVLLLSLLGLISLKDIDGWQTIYSLFDNDEYVESFFLLISIISILYLIAIGVSIFIRFLGNLGYMFMLLMIDSKQESNIFLHYFLKDIVRMYRLPYLKSNSGMNETLSSEPIK